MAASVRLRTNPHVWEQPRSFINAGLHRETLNDDILEAAYFALPARRAVVETMAEHCAPRSVCSLAPVTGKGGSGQDSDPLFPDGTPLSQFRRAHKDAHSSGNVNGRTKRPVQTRRRIFSLLVTLESFFHLGDAR